MRRDLNARPVLVEGWGDSIETSFSAVSTSLLDFLPLKKNYVNMWNIKISQVLHLYKCNNSRISAMIQLIEFFYEIQILETILNNKCGPLKRMLRIKLDLSINHQFWFLLPVAQWTYAYYETGSGLELWPCSRPQPALRRHRTHQAVPALFYDAITQTWDVTQVRYCGETPYSLLWQKNAFNTNRSMNCK